MNITSNKILPYTYRSYLITYLVCKVVPHIRLYLVNGFNGSLSINDKNFMHLAKTIGQASEPILNINPNNIHSLRKLGIDNLTYHNDIRK